MSNLDVFDLTNIEFIESLVSETNEKWFNVKEFSFKFVERKQKEKTKISLNAIHNNKSTAQDVGIDLFFNSFVDWKNVKLFDILDEETIETLLKTGKVTEEDLNKDLPFSQNLFDSLLLRHDIANDLMLEYHKYNERKKKVYKKK